MNDLQSSIIASLVGPYLLGYIWGIGRIFAAAQGKFPLIAAQERRRDVVFSLFLSLTWPIMVPFIAMVFGLHGWKWPFSAQKPTLTATIWENTATVATEPAGEPEVVMGLEGWRQMMAWIDVVDGVGLGGYRGIRLNTAEAEPASCLVVPSHIQEQVPVWHCECGYYATTHVPQALLVGLAVIVKVEARGKTIICDEGGWRSAGYLMRAIWLDIANDDLWEALRGFLVKRYQVPVMRGVPDEHRTTSEGSDSGAARGAGPSATTDNASS